MRRISPVRRTRSGKGVIKIDCLEFVPVPLVSVVSTATFAPSGPPSSMPAAGTPVQTASQALKNAIATLQQQRART